MNTFTSSPNMALSIAHQTIDDRVAQAQHRAEARAARSARRTARRERPRLTARPPEQVPTPWWAFRFVHPVH